jgi:hypothetical protein
VGTREAFVETATALPDVGRQAGVSHTAPDKHDAGPEQLVDDLPAHLTGANG